MAKIIINVMPKPVLLDPQGKAVKDALGRLGVETFDDVRVGRALELSVSGEVTADVREKAETLAKELFINDELEYIAQITVQEG